MEEIIMGLSRKNSQHTEKIKITPEQKITQLHDLVQGYLYKCDEKRIENLLPCLEKTKIGLEDKYQEKMAALEFKPSERQMIQFHMTKNGLVEEIKTLAKQLENSKNKSKEIKIKRIELEEQLRRSTEILKELEHKYSKYDSKKYLFNTGRKSTFPRISGFNYNLHHTDPSRKSNNHSATSFDTSRTSAKAQDQKQNFYNSINFKRIKEVQKLLDEISADCPSHKFQKILIGDNTESIAKRVFKNFSINEFFDNFIHQKHVLKFLHKIQKL